MNIIGGYLMVVVNITNKDLKIPEIRSIVPADGKKYILPHEIAVKYKAYLKPVQMSDTPPVPKASDDPISKQITEMNQNAVDSLNQLEKEVAEQNNIELEETTTQNEVVVEEDKKDDDDWDKKTKLEKIEILWENNPAYTIVKIAEYAGCSYIYAQKIVGRLKKAKEEEEDA
jgi:hypothetical protein